MNPNDCDDFSPLGAPGQILIAPDSFYENGGPFYSTPTPTTTPTNSKKRSANGCGKEEKANKTSKKGTKKNQKKGNQSGKGCDDIEITPQVGPGAVPSTLNDFVSLTGSCLKYEMLRQQFASLRHDFMHLKYRYEVEMAKGKKKKVNVATDTPKDLSEDNNGYEYVPTSKKQSKKRAASATLTSPQKKKKIELVEDGETQRWVDDSFENNEGQLSGSSSSSSSASP